MLQKKIKLLIKIIEGTEIGEIEISSFWGINKIRLRKSNFDSTTDVITDIPIVEEKLEHQLSVEKSDPIDKPITKTIKKELEIISTTEDTIQSNSTEEIIAPLVGTFYASPKADSPPFINIGDLVTAGQTVCIIEAMKIFNEIESEISGKVIKILINDTTPVEFGQPMFLVEPQ